MSLFTSVLTPRQFRVWDLFRSGLRQSSIARRLKISRQATNLTLNQAHLKMNRALRAAAKLHNLQIDAIDEQQGFITGYSPPARTRLTILYTLRYGLRVWYHHDTGDCHGCPEYETCIDTLKEEALRRGIVITKRESALQPGQLAELLFARIKEISKKRR